MKISTFVSCVVLGAAALSSLPAAAAPYRIDLLLASDGQAPGPTRETAAYAINNAGQIAGWTYSASDGLQQAAMWNGLTATTLDPFPGLPRSVSNGINSAGRVVGFAVVDTAAYPQRPVLWNAGGTTSFDTQGGHHAVAYAINDHGQTAGASNSATSEWHQATLWNGTAATTLTSLGGLTSEARDLNNAGQVVGYADTTSGSSHATLWHNGTVTDLGTLGGSYSLATGINEGGTIVGRSATAGTGEAHATVWSGGVLTDLGTLLGPHHDNFSSAHAINGAGDIVGLSSDGQYGTLATLWRDGEAVDLNNFLDPQFSAAGWRLSGALDINDHGAIVGTAVNDTLGVYAGYVLTPIPEPETVVLMLAGLGLLGAAARRKA
ncbi:MAG: hypothetical protein RLZZ618_1531 [Pseudomonadota bacterium]|jgi:probable HAF family extracellular repeat protein